MSDLPPRKRLTLSDQVAILKRQAICPLCREPLGDGEITDEHMTARGLGGSEDLSNRAFVHKTCGLIKTNGAPTKTSGRSSDKTEIARTKHLRMAQDAHRQALDNIATPESEKPARGRRKWPSRPFPKRRLPQHPKPRQHEPNQQD